MADQIPAAVVGGVAGALAGAFASVVLPRVWRWRTPVISTETGELARRSVSASMRAFEASMNSRGRLEHPWEVDGETLHASKLRVDLRQSSARVSNKDFSSYVAMIQERLDAVAANYRERGPRVYFADSPPSAAYQEADRQIGEVAAEQVRSAEEGYEYCLPALDLLDKLERHA